MSPVSESQKRAAEKYVKSNYDEIKVRVPKGTKEQIKDHAELIDGSLNKFINRAIDETIGRDNEKG